MAQARPRRPRDFVIRQPRLRDVRPTVAEQAPERRPRRMLSFPQLLLFGFVLLTVTGGLLLMLPVARHQAGFTSPVVSFFTAVSATTVTGHTVVNTSTYWTGFGQAVIFFLMLVGGLGFMAVATFLLAIIGQRSTLPERLMARETMGVDRMTGLRRMARLIVVVVFLIYIAGAALIFWRIHGMDGMGLAKSLWQSAFLSVSSFNNAGFSIMPESPPGSGLARLGSQGAVLGMMMVLIILGGIGWTVLADIFRRRRFARFSLDTKLVIVTSLGLWVFGAVALFAAEFSNPDTYAGLSTWDRAENSIFHSVSGRTAGFATIDFGRASEFTKLTYPALMFIGGGAGSIAGGIKVATFAVIIAAVLSTVRGRQQTEAFGREIPQLQVLRALTVGALGLGLIMVMMPTLAWLEPDIHFLDLLFDTVSAFGTAGFSTGIVPEMSVAGKSLLMATMLIGRLGPLTLALALGPREEATAYRFAQERVRIG